ncbi:hypothetical protein CyaNS01_02355 [Cyanobium sp. NS01]|nr:hypothetical protein CyaNS01_02355 [Cyanobium sp. NS01]
MSEPFGWIEMDLKNLMPDAGRMAVDFSRSLPMSHHNSCAMT